jgi:hypothetical protein
VYWDQDWRRENSRENKGLGRSPENELWDAVAGYLDLLDASQTTRFRHASGT